MNIKTDRLKQEVTYQFDVIDDFVRNQMMVGVCQYIPYEEWPKFVNHPTLSKLAQMMKDPDSLKNLMSGLDTLKDIKQNLLNFINDFDSEVRKASILLESFGLPLEEPTTLLTGKALDIGPSIPTTLFYRHAP